MGTVSEKLLQIVSPNILYLVFMVTVSEIYQYSFCKNSSVVLRTPLTYNILRLLLSHLIFPVWKLWKQSVRFYESVK